MAAFDQLLLVAIVFLLLSASQSMDEEEIKKNRLKVLSMFQHGYDSYIRHAFPRDELCPLTCSGRDTWGSYSLTLIDSLDTLLIMGNVSEFQKAYRYVTANMTFNGNVNVSVFETNIRVIGGLLSAHLLSVRGEIPLAPGWPCEGPLLRLAESLARRILPGKVPDSAVCSLCMPCAHLIPITLKE
jgi:mannosidase alpha-like ER degradation enhancer 2